MFYNKKTRKWRTSKKKESRDEGNVIKIALEQSHSSEELI